MQQLQIVSNYFTDTAGYTSWIPLYSPLKLNHYKYATLPNNFI